MPMKRSYYSKTVGSFLADDNALILGELSTHHQFDLTDLQRNSWISQIEILKQAFAEFLDGHILFEYSIPRMGKRIDAVLILRDFVFPIEFKHNADTYTSHAIDQVLDYSLDLKNFHEESHHCRIIPIVLASEAPSVDIQLFSYDDLVFKPLCANPSTLPSVISKAIEAGGDSDVDALAWERSRYSPTPTIIEAAQALYKGHRVQEISRSDAGAINLHETSAVLDRIIDDCKKTHKKAICFVTGVPGAGKTLAGLNIANHRHLFEEEEHAVFLSGNGPLVAVLQEALARDKVEAAQQQGQSVTKQSARAATKAFIQNIHHFRDDSLKTDVAPIERVAIFDEAQRAWTQKKTESFMRQKKGISDFEMSEPEFLISVLDRHEDWAVIICLIGGGQEINTGEAGLPEWFRALREKYSSWEIYVSSTLTEFEYTQGNDLYRGLNSENVKNESALHLAVSVRSYRSELVSEFVKELLDCNQTRATDLYTRLSDDYPIVLTRDINTAKTWLKSKARGSERYGLIASSGAYRLRTYGIHIKADIEPIHWFLNDKQDVRSCYFLEDVATEFDIQGLELDWTGVAWDANLRFDGGQWEYKSFSGTKWKDVKKEDNQLYLKNAYRVLLTRARQGMVVFLPQGDWADHTRADAYYDTTYEYLRSIGITEI